MKQNKSTESVEKFKEIGSPNANTSQEINQDGFLQVPQGKIINGYTFEELLGQGAFGRVFLVQKDNIFYAAKVARRGATYQAALQKEIKIAKLLQQQNVLPELITAFTYETLLISVSQCCEQTLEEYLVTNKHGVDYKSFKKLARQLIQKLQIIHSHQIIHADVKPANIMLLKQNDLDSLRFIDFGTCIFQNETPNIYMQTRWYRAPEVQFKMLPYSSKIDTWGLGCVLFQCRKNQLLFCALDNYMLCRQYISLLGVPPPKITSRDYFVPNSFKYYFEHKQQLQELNLDKDQQQFPNNSVLKAVGKPQCELRDFHVEMQNLLMDEDYEQEEQIFNIISNLVQYDFDKRWDCSQALRCSLFDSYI